LAAAGLRHFSPPVGNVSGEVESSDSKYPSEGKPMSRDLPARIARAVDQVCAVALPHLQMTVLSLLAIIVMETAPLIGPLHFVIR
jgi:hypothetical protein